MFSSICCWCSDHKSFPFQGEFADAVWMKLELCSVKSECTIQELNTLCLILSWSMNFRLISVLKQCRSWFHNVWLHSKQKCNENIFMIYSKRKLAIDDPTRWQVNEIECYYWRGWMGVCVTWFGINIAEAIVSEKVIMSAYKHYLRVHKQLSNFFYWICDLSISLQNYFKYESRWTWI